MSVCLNHADRQAVCSCGVCAEPFCASCVDNPGPGATCTQCLKATRTSSLDPTNTESCWRDGEVLVLRPNTSLPARCVKCNEPAELPMKPRKFAWHPPALYLLILLNLIIYAIVASITQKKTSVALGLCVAHRKRRQLGSMIGWGGSILGLVVMFWGFSASGVLAVLGVIILLGSLIYGMVLSRLASAQRIAEDFVRLKGCGPLFLASLPEFHV